MFQSDKPRLNDSSTSNVSLVMLLSLYEKMQAVPAVLRVSHEMSGDTHTHTQTPRHLSHRIHSGNVTPSFLLCRVISRDVGKHTSQFPFFFLL